MKIEQKIDTRLYNFYSMFPFQPDGILMNPLTFEQLENEFRHNMDFIALNGFPLKYRGIDILRSHDVKEGEIKLVID
jgi:hypothetical protein